MKRTLLILVAIVSLWSGCAKDEVVPVDSPITVPDQTQLEQVVYADNTTGSSEVSFATSGPWTSTISEVSPVTTTAIGIASDTSRSWITISPASGDKAGVYKVNILLTVNNTGADRSAAINIVCNGTAITINVKQQATTKDQDKPTSIKKLVKIIDSNSYTDSLGRIHDTTFYATLYEYDAQSRLIKVYDQGGDTSRSYIVYTYPTPNTIKSAETNGVSVWNEILYTLNSSGYIITQDAANTVSPRDTSRRDTSHTNPWKQYVYQADYLSQYIDNGGFTINYTWADGVLKRSAVNTSWWRVEYEYSTQPANKGNIDITALVLYQSYLTDLGALGYMGKRAKYLPSKEILYTDYNEDGLAEMQNTCTYQYTTDTEGYVVTVVRKDTYGNTATTKLEWQ